jgi:hypothetical protein
MVEAVVEEITVEQTFWDKDCPILFVRRIDEHWKSLKSGLGKRVKLTALNRVTVVSPRKVENGDS